MKRFVAFSAVAVWALMGTQAFSSDSVLVVNRGLPQYNLNNGSGKARSNVRWGVPDQGFVGDELTVGTAGERWVIDSIRTWAVPGTAGHIPDHLADFYEDVRLYVGGSDSGLTPVSTARLKEGSDETTNPGVVISTPTEPGEAAYDDFGTNLRVWQVDFSGLNLTVEGGQKYRFGVWGMGRAIAGTDGKTYTWYNHASNAPLSGTRQDGASGVMQLFDAAGRPDGTFNSEGHGWDKPANINVQVFAHRVTVR